MSPIGYLLRHLVMTCSLGILLGRDYLFRQVHVDHVPLRTGDALSLESSFPNPASDRVDADAKAGCGILDRNRFRATLDTYSITCLIRW